MGKTVEVTFESAERTAPELAPAWYRPRMLRDEIVNDENLDSLPKMMPWRQFFAGGSNRLYFVRTDQEGNQHFVEGIDLQGRYEAYGPGYGRIYTNAYDAFWAADRASGADADQPEADQPGRGGGKPGG